MSKSERAKSVIKTVARVGYLSKSVVYACVGALAIAAALNIDFGKVGGADSAIETFDEGTIAPIILALTGFGLIGYILWKFVQVVWDPEKHSDSAPRAFVRRTFYAISGLAYTSVSFTAIASAIGMSSGGQSGKKSAIEWLIGVSYGRYLIVALGGLVIGFGVYQAYKGYHDQYLDNLKEYDMPGWLRRVVTYIGPIGHFGRAAVFAVIGGLVAYAGYTYDPSEAGGTAEAMRWLASQPWGEYMLLAVGAAFVCYGLFIATKARYRRFELA